MYSYGIDTHASAAKENPKIRNYRSIIFNKGKMAAATVRKIWLRSVNTAIRNTIKGRSNFQIRFLSRLHFPMRLLWGGMRKTLLERAQTEFAPIPVEETFGYLTKAERLGHGLPKEHYVDARCIAGHPEARPAQIVFFSRKARCHNRQIHKFNPSKGGIRKLNQSAKVIMGFQLFDKIRYEKTECFIFAKRTSGRFDIRTLDGTVVSASVSWKKLKRLESSNGWLVDKQWRQFLPTASYGVSLPH